MDDETVRTLVAAAPIATVLLLLLFKTRPLVAGLLGIGTAAVGLLAFPISSGEAAEALSGLGPTVAEVAIIMFGGVGLADSMVRSGAQDAIAGWMSRISDETDRTLTLLLLVFGLTPFMESVIGYGLGIVITGPLLIRHGLDPVKAVVVGMLGLGTLVPWGSLGPGTLIAASLGGEDFGRLGVWSALLTLPVLIIVMCVVLVVSKARLGLRNFALPALTILVHWTVLVATNLVIGPPLAGVISSAAVITTLLSIAWLRTHRLPTFDATLRRAVAPYAVLIAGILAVTAVRSIFELPAWCAVFSSPAAWVIVALCVALITSHLSRRETISALTTVVGRWMTVAGTTIIFLLLGIVMSVSGMAADLALTVASVGPSYAAFVPAIGALGGYLTATNSGSAAMFSAATTTIAHGIGANPLIWLAGQNVAGSFAIIASPPRIALAVDVAMPSGEVLPRRAVAILAGAVVLNAVVVGGTMLVFS